MSLISFFLNVSFPRIQRKYRALRGDRGKSAYTGQNHFEYFTHTVSILTLLLTLTPFVSSADTFPDKRGQLTFSILSFIYSFSIRTSWHSKNSLAVILERWTKWEC